MSSMEDWRPTRPSPPVVKIVDVTGPFAVILAVRFVGLQYSDVPGDVLLAILAAGVLVGFAEEMLFREVFLRCMRTNGRTEGSLRCGRRSRSVCSI
jgi:hypothetical protein